MHSDDIEFDEHCDPNNPVKIKYDNIVAATRRIAGSIIHTPCIKTHLSDSLGMQLYFKQEFLQHTGCFKERGVRNTLLLLSEDQKKAGVITASTGNHATAMSYHSHLMGIPCIVVIPIYAPIMKRKKCEMYHAKVILHGTNVAQSKYHALALSKEKKMVYINGFDHPNIVEGQGSCGIEILEQVPQVDAVLVPVGGGSLLAGIAVAIKHLKPDTEVYGVVTNRTYSMVEALRKNDRVKIEIDSTIADGLAVPTVGVNTFHTIKGLVDKMVVVKEDWVARAIMHIVEEEKFVVEGAGAVPVASIMAGLFPNLKDKTVVCVLSGGNIETTILARALERGMAAEGRLVKFKVTVKDRPGGLSELCNVLAAIRCTIRDCIPERAWVKGDVFSAELKVIAETRGWEHTKELVEIVKKHYQDCLFPDMGDRLENPPPIRRGPCLATNPACMMQK